METFDRYSHKGAKLIQAVEEAVAIRRKFRVKAKLEGSTQMDLFPEYSAAEEWDLSLSKEGNLEGVATPILNVAKRPQIKRSYRIFWKKKRKKAIK